MKTVTSPFIITNGTPIAPEDIQIPVFCSKGHPTGVLARDLTEMAAGVWGTIPCGECGERLNDRINKLDGHLVDLRVHQVRMDLGIRSGDWSMANEAAVDIVVATLNIRKITTGK